MDGGTRRGRVAKVKTAAKIELYGMMSDIEMIVGVTGFASYKAMLHLRNKSLFK